MTEFNALSVAEGNTHDKIITYGVLGEKRKKKNDSVCLVGSNCNLHRHEFHKCKYYFKESEENNNGTNFLKLF